MATCSVCGTAMLSERPHQHAATTRPLSAEAHQILARDLYDFGITSPKIEEALGLTTDDTRPLDENDLAIAYEMGYLRAVQDERARYAALVAAARAAVDAAGTNNWPVNCDRLRAALDGEPR